MNLNKLASKLCKKTKRLEFQDSNSLELNLNLIWWLVMAVR